MMESFSVAQLNAGVYALRQFAYTVIKQKVPGWLESQAEAYVTDNELLAAVKVVAEALESTS
jgi:hypothetical protein